MPRKPKVPPAVSDYMRELGKKGGATTGRAKRRGSAEYYRELVNKRWKAKPENE